MSTVAVTLREATVADIPAIAGMMRALRDEDPMPHGTSLEQSLCALETLLTESALGVAWLLERNMTEVGYAVLTFCHSLELGGRIGFVDELFVAPAARGEGVGGATLHQIATLSAALGLVALHIEVSPRNRAEALYARAGFKTRSYNIRTLLLPPR